MPLPRRRLLLDGAKGLLAVRLAMPVAGSLLGACGARSSLESDMRAPLIARPATDQWPSLIQQAPPETREAYRFAATPAGRELLRWQKCWCGCERSDGHQSNLDCFVDDVRADGSIVLDRHGYG